MCARAHSQEIPILNQHNDRDDTGDDNSPQTLREMIGSVFAAAIGIQSNTRRERDFSRGSAHHYVALGLIGTLLFILAVYGAVRLILALAT